MHPDFVRWNPLGRIDTLPRHPVSCEVDRFQGSLVMKSILDRSFRYTPSIETDLRKTFARIRREQRQTAAPVAAREGNARVVCLMPVKRG